MAKKKILVVDDSLFMLTLINDILSKLNYAVTTVDNGREACQAVEAERFDLIITDLNMPGMDGLEFTRQVRTLPNCKFVPIVMLSGEEDKEKIATARQLGISTFISKPPRAEQIKSILNIILNKRGAPRFAVEVDVAFGNGRKYRGRTGNISTTGLFLQAEEPLLPGEKVELQIELPGSAQPLTCKARVAWAFTAEASDRRQHPAGMGMEFLDLGEVAAIKEFLETH